MHSLEGEVPLQHMDRVTMARWIKFQEQYLQYFFHAVKSYHYWMGIVLEAVMHIS